MATDYVSAVPDTWFGAYHRDGMQMLPGLVDADELVGLIAAAEAAFAKDGMHLIVERDGSTVHSVYRVHRTGPAVVESSRRPELVGMARRSAGGEVYMDQCRINLKAACGGDLRRRHKDYVYWLQDDGIRRPGLVNAAVFLDEVTEFESPLAFGPGSHRDGLRADTSSEAPPRGYEDAPGWVAVLTVDDECAVDLEVIEGLVRARGMASPKDPAGTVLFCQGSAHPNLLYASAASFSPLDRSGSSTVYAETSDRSTSDATPSPKFLSPRRYTLLGAV